MSEVTKSLGRYEILRQIGRGGMAVVYLARQRDLERMVALKELHAVQASDPSLVRRFVRESRVAGSLAHPNIVTVYDYFEWEGTPYIAMEYVASGSLRPYVGRLSLAQVAGVLEGMLAGLSHAEQHGIVHRDLKPENVMVTGDGRVKIADFGIAKATTGLRTGSFLTATGTTLGTPAYMAPEQAMAQKVGPWTDLYSVGCMAYEMVTGGLPFAETDAPLAVLLRHVSETPAPAISVDPTIDQRVSDWIDRLLRKSPDDRPQSADAAWHELEEIVFAIEGPRWTRSARPLPLVTGSPEERGAVPGPYTPPSQAGVPQGEPFASYDLPGIDTPVPPSPPATPAVESGEYESYVPAPGSRPPTEEPDTGELDVPAAEPSPPEQAVTSEPPAPRLATPVPSPPWVPPEPPTPPADSTVRRLAAPAEHEARAHPESAATNPPADTGRARPEPVERGESAAGRPALLRRQGLRLIAGVLVISAVVSLALIVFGGKSPSEEGKTARQQPRGVIPYDFDGDGRQELVVSMPSGRGGPADRAGVVKVASVGGERREPVTITSRSANLTTRSNVRDGFGGALASGDFNGDKRSDLAIGAYRWSPDDRTDRPGAVAVLFARRNGLSLSKTQSIFGSDFDGVTVEPQFGVTMAAGDVDNDGFDDLVTSARSADEAPRGSGTVFVVFGGKDGLDSRHPQVIPRPSRADNRFGSRLDLGDFDRDGHLDLIEAAPNFSDDVRDGHAYFCRGSSRGPKSCRRMADPERGGPASLAVGNVNGDRYPDVVQGYASDPFRDTEGNALPGEIRILEGGLRGPIGQPRSITQDSPNIPGHSENGDAFGHRIAVGDLDSDGFADVVVGAPGEDQRAGRITVIRGAREGYAEDGNASYRPGRDGIPRGRTRAGKFGDSLSLLDFNGDRTLDLAVTAEGQQALRDAVVLIEGRQDLALAPGPESVSNFRKLGGPEFLGDIHDVRLGH